jgi:hypothetical protein
MKLISVQSAQRNLVGTVDLMITADLEDGAGEQPLPFTWSADDPHGLGPAVTGYMAAHPDLPIAEALPAPNVEAAKAT